MVGRFINADGYIAGVSDSVQGYNLFAYCFNNPVNMSDATGQWPSWGTIFKAAAIVVVAAAVVAAVVVTVSTFGAGSVAGVAVISSAISIAAKTTEVVALQAKKSVNDGKNGENHSGGGNGASGGGGSGGNKSGSGSSNERKSGGQVVTDVVDAVFDNGLKILSPSATKVITTGASFIKDDLFNNPVLNSDFSGFMAGSASKLSMATAYGFSAFAWIQTTISIFSDDPVHRAEQRGYKLK